MLRVEKQLTYQENILVDGFRRLSPEQQTFLLRAVADLASASPPRIRLVSNNSERLTG